MSLEFSRVITHRSRLGAQPLNCEMREICELTILFLDCYI